MKYRSSSKIFAGLFLVFFYVNFYHLNTLTFFLGTMLITTASWQLAGVNDNFKFAFICGVVQLILQAINLVLVCLRLSSNMNIEIATSVICALSMIVLFYNLFTGLGLLANEQGYGELAHKLHLCCFFYAGLSLLMIMAALIPPLAILAIPAALIIIIYILVQGYRVKQIMDRDSGALAERKPSLRYSAITICCVVFVGALCIAALIFKNCPAIHTAVYMKVDSAEKADIQSIKSNLLTLGFDPGVLGDLPDNEIKNYQNALSVHNTVQQQQTDGGTLQGITIVSFFKDGAARYLFYYKWLTPPHHQFCDSFDVILSPDAAVMPTDIRFNGFGLYDKKAADGVTTYKANFVKYQASPPSFPRITYRVLGAGALNQRGFFAFDAHMSRASLETNYGVFINCLHQKSLFNLASEADAKTELQQMAMNGPGFAYDQFQYITEEVYKP